MTRAVPPDPAVPVPEPAATARRGVPAATGSDREQRAFLEADRATRATVLPVLSCPLRAVHAVAYNGTNGQTDYAGCGGPVPWADGGAIGRDAGVRVTDLRGGSSQTVLAGHTRLNADQVGTAQHARDWGWAAGWDWDTVRWTALTPAGDWRDASPGWYARDGTGSDGERFGGPHGACPVALADGSVRAVGPGVSPAAWRAAGDRRSADPGGWSD